MAYDIHDALSQLLGVVKLNLETTVAETAIDTRQYTRLADVVRMVDELIRQTRDLTFDLHPAMLDHFGLVPTLQRYGEEIGRHATAEVSINEIGEGVTLPTELASYLFRAIKEIINNSIKHGNAKQIVVTFHWSQGQVRIVTDDDGCGFNTQQAMTPQIRRGLGLAGIHEPEFAGWQVGPGITTRWWNPGYYGDSLGATTGLESNGSYISLRAPLNLLHCATGLF